VPNRSRPAHRGKSKAVPFCFARYSAPRARLLQSDITSVRFSFAFFGFGDPYRDFSTTDGLFPLARSRERANLVWAESAVENYEGSRHQKSAYRDKLSQIAR
jgi:hypothetical protein